MKSISKNFVEIIPSSFQPVVGDSSSMLEFCFSSCVVGVFWSSSLSLSLSLQQPVLVGLVESVAAADHQVVEIWISSWNLSRILFLFLSSQVWAEIRTVEFFLNGKEKILHIHKLR
jgi:hypothetical protein